MKNALSIFLLIFVFSSCTDDKNYDKVNEISNELIQLDFTKKDSLKVEGIVSLNDGLIGKLEELTKNSKFITTIVTSQDLESFFGEADYLIRIESDLKAIDIRLKYNPEKDKFDILGWKTL